MKLGNYEVHFTTDFYSYRKESTLYYRDCYIIDEKHGTVYLKICYGKDYDCKYTALDAFIPSQLTENGYHVYAETIEL